MTHGRKYPHKCCRCGYCCLHVVCPVGQLHFPFKHPCPALSFEGEVARCNLARFEVPIDDGCCIKATAYRQGKSYDFAAMPVEWKRRAVYDLLNSMAHGRN